MAPTNETMAPGMPGTDTAFRGALNASPTPGAAVLAESAVAVSSPAVVQPPDPTASAPGPESSAADIRVSLRMVSSAGVLGHEQLYAGDVISIGRRAQNLVVLNDMTVSGQHAEIRRCSDGPGFQLADLNSRNGTVVDGRAVDLIDLTDGDQIEIGIFRMEFRGVAVTATQAADAAQQAQLDYLSGGMSGIHQRLERSITRVSASGQVVVIARRKSGWFVTHMEGASRSLLNGAALGGQALPLANNDIIEMNTTRIRFRLL